MAFGIETPSLGSLLGQGPQQVAALKPTPTSNQTRSTIAQCKVVVYRWNQDFNGTDTLPLTADGTPNVNPSDSDLSGSTRLEISSQVVSCSFSKNIGEPAGNFTIELTSSPQFGSNDWLDILKRGTWAVIYMAQDGSLALNNRVGPPKTIASEAKYIRCIGFIDKVAVKMNVGEKGELDVSFEIAGRDFGIIYEDTSIWHNVFHQDSIMLDGVKLTGLNVLANIKLDAAIRTVHDLIFFPQNIPGAKLNDDKSLTSIGLQWLLPKEMLTDIGFVSQDLRNGTYWGALAGDEGDDLASPHSTLLLTPTACGISLNNPADFLSGGAWEALKRMSVPQFHELFCETDATTGLPALIFRPIPWGINDSKYQSALNQQGGSIQLFKDLAAVTPIPALDLIDVNIAADNHARYNHFLSTVATTLYNASDNINPLQGTRFPLLNRASVKRYGFRPMHTTVDTLVNNSEQANGEVNNNLVAAFNEVMVDYWANAAFSKTGTITKIGTPDIKVGYALEFGSDVPYLFDQRFYIEAYTDSFSVGENGECSWTQDVALTRGFSKQDLNNGQIQIDRRQAFSKAGEYTPGGANK